MIKDIVGNEVKAGSKIAYPCRKGSNMWLQILDVTQVDEHAAQPAVKGYSAKGRPIRITNLDNLVCLHAAV